MPTDEGNQDGHFLFNHPEGARGGLPRCLGARSHCFCRLDPTPPNEGGEGKRGTKRIKKAGGSEQNNSRCLYTLEPGYAYS